MWVKGVIEVVYFLISSPNKHLLDRALLVVLNQNLLTPKDDSNGMSLFLKSFHVVPVDPFKLDVRHLKRKSSVRSALALKSIAGKFWFNHVGANHGCSAVFRLRRRVTTW